MGADLSLNLLDEAKATFDEACARKLDGSYVRQTFYWLAFLRRDVAQMDQQVAWAVGKPGDEDALLSEQSDTEAYYGRLSKARDFHKASREFGGPSGVQGNRGSVAGKCCAARGGTRKHGLRKGRGHVGFGTLSGAGC
jgi:hypothetical protein